jgi:hypothetical protein
MMAKRILITIATALVLSVIALAAVDKPKFAGSWTMDRARSYGLPGNMTQTMTVTQTEERMEVETKLIQPGNERVQKDMYILDGKEHEFQPPTPPAQPGQEPKTPPKGKRTATWLPSGNGLTVTDVTTAETPDGPVTVQIVRKWTLTGTGELVIDMYVDNPNVSYEAKRIFKRS